MKSGDTQRVIFFANVQKQKEIYIMAGNYLQSLDWRKDPEIMKHIINFYTRGKSMVSLANFYEACSQVTPNGELIKTMDGSNLYFQVEIDEFQDYEKATSALAEAYKCLTRGGVSTEESLKAEDLINRLKMKITMVQKFLTAKR